MLNGEVGEQQIAGRRMEEERRTQQRMDKGSAAVKQAGRQAGRQTGRQAGVVSSWEKRREGGEKSDSDSDSSPGLLEKKGG